MEAGMMGKGNEIFVFEMGESVRIVDLDLLVKVHVSSLA